MKCLAILFLVCTFLFGASAAAAAAPDCCEDAQCTWVECVEMGCVAGVAPAVPAPACRVPVARPANDWHRLSDPAVADPPDALVKPPD